MSIVGFNFTKINAERKRAVLGTVNISNNITLKEVAETKIGIAGPRGAIRVSFLFRSVYTPDLATLALEGDVLMLAHVNDLDKFARAEPGLLAAYKFGDSAPKLPPLVYAEVTIDKVIRLDLPRP